MRRAALALVIVLAALGLSGALSATFAALAPLSAGSTVWFYPGFTTSDFLSWAFPPSTEATEGLYAAFGLAVAWLFWAAVMLGLVWLVRRRRFRRHIAT